MQNQAQFFVGWGTLSLINICRYGKLLDNEVRLFDRKAST